MCVQRDAMRSPIQLHEAVETNSHVQSASMACGVRLQFESLPSIMHCPWSAVSCVPANHSHVGVHLAAPIVIVAKPVSPRRQERIWHHLLPIATMSLHFSSGWCATFIAAANSSIQTPIGPGEVSPPSPPARPPQTNAREVASPRSE